MITADAPLQEAMCPLSLQHIGPIRLMAAEDETIPQGDSVNTQLQLCIMQAWILPPLGQ